MKLILAIYFGGKKKKQNTKQNQNFILLFYVTGIFFNAP